MYFQSVYKEKFHREKFHREKLDFSFKHESLLLVSYLFTAFISQFPFHATWVLTSLVSLYSFYTKSLRIQGSIKNSLLLAGYPKKPVVENYLFFILLFTFGLLFFYSCKLVQFSYGNWDEIVSIREKLLSWYRPTLSENTQLTEALFFGSREKISVQDSLLFEISGTQHLLALSGTHVAIYSGIIFLFIKTIRRKKTQFWIFTMFLIGYWLLIVPSPSAYRAISMVLCYKVYTAFSRRGSKLTIILLSLFSVSCIYPGNPFSAGSILSYTAILGIWIFYRPLQKRIPGPLHMRNILALGFSAQLGLLGPLILFFSRISLQSVFASIVPTLLLTAILALILIAILVHLLINIVTAILGFGISETGISGGFSYVLDHLFALLRLNLHYFKQSPTTIDGVLLIILFCLWIFVICVAFFRKPRKVIVSAPLL